MTAGYSLRPEAPGETDAIAAVIAAAFALSDPAGGEAALVAALRRAGALTLSLVAQDAQGELLGHIAFSPVDHVAATGSEEARRCLGLAPLAVVPAAQRRGVGAALVQAGLAAARAQGWALVVVLGEPGYYRRFGFRPAARLGLAWEHPAPAEAFMALVLDEAVPPPPPGLLRYHSAFDSFAA